VTRLASSGEEAVSSVRAQTGHESTPQLHEEVQISVAQASALMQKREE